MDKAAIFFMGMMAGFSALALFLIATGATYPNGMRDVASGRMICALLADEYQETKWECNEVEE